MELAFLRARDWRFETLDVLCAASEDRPHDGDGDDLSRKGDIDTTDCFAKFPASDQACYGLVAERFTAGWLDSRPGSQPAAFVGWKAPDTSRILDQSEGGVAESKQRQASRQCLVLL